MKEKQFLNLFGIGFIAILLIAAVNAEHEPTITHKDCLESYAVTICECADLFGITDPNCKPENE
jgi:hypothetical protein